MKILLCLRRLSSFGEDYDVAGVNFDAYKASHRGYLSGGPDGVRVLQTRSLMDSAGTHLLWLARNNWVWFSWGNPPVTGATRHWAIRCIAWSTSRDAGATINYGSFFVDAALDSPTGTENWTVYSIATMPTGGPV
jgi:hypothetical protein